MKETEEYSSLRNEILGLISIQNNYIIAMYTITVTILVFGIERKNEWIFLLPYIILFSFQKNISAKKDAMIRIAAYITVFHENGMGWESFHEKIVDNTSGGEEKGFSIKSFIAGKVASFQLAAVCSIGTIIQCVYNNVEKWKGDNSFWSFLHTSLPIILAIVLYFLLRFIYANALKLRMTRQEYIKRLKLIKYEKEKI